MTLPVIMATGTALPLEEFRAHPWLQPAATLLKPYTGEEVLKAVAKVLLEAEEAADSAHEFFMEPDTVCAAAEGSIRSAVPAALG